MAKRARNAPIPVPAESRPAADVRKRAAPGVRRQQIVDGAVAFFAAHGFAASTRDLAAYLGVSQALVYKYFPAKAALIDAVIAATFGKRDRRALAQMLADRTVSLVDRLTGFYQAYAARFSANGMRLMMHANLEAHEVARRMSVPLTEAVLRPVCRELRAEAGLPDFDAVAMTHGERELAMTLHSSVVFIGIRKFVYRMPLPDDLSPIVALQVRTFLGGALPMIRALHDDSAWQSWRVSLIAPKAAD